MQNGREKPPKATLKRHQCDLKATPMRIDSQLIATPKPPQCDHKAPTRLPQSANKATPERRLKAKGSRLNDPNRWPKAAQIRIITEGNEKHEEQTNAEARSGVSEASY
jgi:hypothetical protein